MWTATGGKGRGTDRGRRRGGQRYLKGGMPITEQRGGERCKEGDKDGHGEIEEGK